MKITVLENKNMLLEQIYNPVTLKTNSNEEITICMRDSGFEFDYEGKKYSAQKGIIEEVNSNFISIDFGERENITLLEDGDNVRIKIKGLGETRIPSHKLASGINTLLNRKS